MMNSGHKQPLVSWYNNVTNRQINAKAIAEQYNLSRKLLVSSFLFFRIIFLTRNHFLLYIDFTFHPNIRGYMVKPTTQVSKLKVDDGVNLSVSKNFVESPKAAVIIVHGLCEHAGRYDYVASRLNDFGYSVYRFDNRGHGRSGGERGYIDDYQIFIDDTEKIVSIAKKENPGIPLFMLGHSMGGFITAFYGVKYPGRLAGQLLSGAALTIQPQFKDREAFDYNATPMASIPNMLTDLICRDPQVVKAYAQDVLVLKEYTTKLIGEVRIKGQGILWTA